MDSSLRPGEHGAVLERGGGTIGWMIGAGWWAKCPPPNPPPNPPGGGATVHAGSAVACAPGGDASAAREWAPPHASLAGWKMSVPRVAPEPAPNHASPSVTGSRGAAA